MTNPWVRQSLEESLVIIGRNTLTSFKIRRVMARVLKVNFSSQAFQRFACLLRRKKAIKILIHGLGLAQYSLYMTH